jgi:hypothetical protein
LERLAYFTGITTGVALDPVPIDGAEVTPPIVILMG